MHNFTTNETKVKITFKNFENYLKLQKKKKKKILEEF